MWGRARGRRCFASEVRRVARSYWVQTPNRFFPIETHLWMPFVHLLPKAWCAFFDPAVYDLGAGVPAAARPEGALAESLSGRYTAAVRKRAEGAFSGCGDSAGAVGFFYEIADCSAAELDQARRYQNAGDVGRKMGRQARRPSSSLRRSVPEAASERSRNRNRRRGRWRC